MEQLKVALFTGNYNHIRDGVSLTLNRWVQFLLNQGADVLIFGPAVKKPVLSHNGTLITVPSVKMPGRPEYRITTGFPHSQRKELADFNPDIVHLATPDLLGYKALKWAEKHRKPVVSSYHTHFTSYLKYYHLNILEPLGWAYLRWFYQNCKQVYVPTQSMIDELRQNGINRGLRIWARGVDTKLFHPSKKSEQWREKMGFGRDDIVVTFVSRLVWEKNLKLFADVVKKLENREQSVRSLVVGNGPAMAELEKMLSNTVFTGFLQGESLAVAYASSDVFFFPSDTETFGNVTLEAMASGLPCVVANASGSRSLVEHEKNGFLASVEKQDQFYEYVKKLTRDNQLRKNMGRESLQKSADYTWEKINSDLLKNYNQVLKNQAE